MHGFQAKIAFTTTDASDLGLRKLYVKEFVVRRPEILKQQQNEKDKIIGALAVIPSFLDSSELWLRLSRGARAGRMKNPRCRYLRISFARNTL